jgi:hypothetical protein
VGRQNKFERYDLEICWPAYCMKVSARFGARILRRRWVVLPFGLNLCSIFDKWLDEMQSILKSWKNTRATGYTWSLFKYPAERKTRRCSILNSSVCACFKRAKRIVSTIAWTVRNRDGGWELIAVYRTPARRTKAMEAVRSMAATRAD